MDKLVANPFEKITVFLGVLGGAEVSWNLKKDLPFATPWKFKVEQANEISAKWTPIAEVENNVVIIDSKRYKYDILASSYYRVGLVAGDSKVYYSTPTSVGTRLDRRDYTLAKEICRRANQRLRIKSGKKGWLLKRKFWGATCTNCGNEVTKQATNSQCTSCYGTGILGGYYSPFPYSLELQGIGQIADYSEAGSKTNKVKTSARSISFPRIHYKDIWVDYDSGRRYAIQESLNIEAFKRDMPLVISFELHPIETTSVVYNIEVPSIDPTEYEIPSNLTRNLVGVCVNIDNDPAITSELDKLVSAGGNIETTATIINT